MKTTTLTLLTALILPSIAGAAEYEYDAAHSRAHFSVRHMTVATVRGTFSGVTGKVVLDDKDPAKSLIEATIDVSTLDTREPQRDGHLKSPDFFDVAKFPNITFKSKKVTRAKDGRYAVVGDLTLHGVTKEVTLDVTPPTAEVKDVFGFYRLGVTATTRVVRQDYGLKWNKVALETGGLLVGDDVDITLDLELKRKAPAAEATAPAK